MSARAHPLVADARPAHRPGVPRTRPRL